MPYAVVETKLKSLPESMLAEAAQYLDFLIYKSNSSNVKNADPRLANRRAGVIEDADYYMASDFDETPECFKDYL